MQSVYFEFDLFCKYIPYLSKLYPVDKKQWKVGVRLAYDRHCTREDDSDLREKKNKQTNKQNKTKQMNKTKRTKLLITTGWVTHSMQKILLIPTK